MLSTVQKPRPQRFAAIDTDVLLALEAGDDVCLEAIDRLEVAGFYCLVTETPLQELGDICQSSDPEATGHAQATLVEITNFGFLKPQLTSVQMGVAERVAQKIVEVGLVGGMLNDGLVIAEAAYQNCRILLSNRPVMLASNKDSLKIALVDFDLWPVVVAAPTEIVNYYRRQSPPAAGT